MDVMITYLKANGSMFTRIVKSAYNLRVGDITPMGWKVINIHYNYNGNYYTYHDYCRLIRGKDLKRKEHKVIKYLIKKLQKMAN